jgi:hypothetical protein
LNRYRAVLHAAADACETGASFRERSQVVALLTAGRCTS